MKQRNVEFDIKLYKLIFCWISWFFPKLVPLLLLFKLVHPDQTDSLWFRSVWFEDLSISIDFEMTIWKIKDRLVTLV